MRELSPVKLISGTIAMPGDKSIAHRAALLSILASEPITVSDFPSGADCQTSLEAAKLLGVTVTNGENGEMVLTPPETLPVGSDTLVDCGNSGTTARLLSGVIAGSDTSVVLSGDESLSTRPMSRIVKPLADMGAEVFDTDGHLPLTVRGKKLLPFEYRMPVASAQVKSSILLAGLASECSVTVQEQTITRNHTELMIAALGGDISTRLVKAVVQEDPDDPRKKKRFMPEPFKKEISLASGARLAGGSIEIPGDISTAAFFFAAAAISGQTITVRRCGLNPTRTAFLDYLKQIGCTVEITEKELSGGEPRGTVIVTGGLLKSRKISGDTTVGLIDEIPIVAVIAAFAKGTTVIRDAAELKVKESNRLEAIAHNLGLMGISCGLLEDGLAIEGGIDPSGADFKSFGDHRIAMAFSIASLFVTGPSTIDDDSVVDISCPEFYSLLDNITG